MISLRRIALGSLVVWLATAGLAVAQEPAPTGGLVRDVVAPPGTARVSGDSGPRRELQRGPSLVMQSLYSTTVIVQAFHAESTFAAHDAGASEGIPLIGSLADKRPLFIALKGGIAAATIFLGRDISKRSKAKAVLVLVGINSAYAALAVHNYRVAAAMR